MVNYKKIGVFLGFLIIYSLILVLTPYFIFNREYTLQSLPWIAGLDMFSPLLAAISTEWYFKSPSSVFNLNLKLNKFFIFSWLLPVVFAGGSLFIASLFPEILIEYNPEALPHRLSPWISSFERSQMEYFNYFNPVTPTMILFQGLIGGIFTSTLLAYGEERGWRGFLIKELSPLGFWKSSYLVGIIWGLWHFPLIIQGYNFPDHPLMGVLLMTIACGLLSPLMVFLTQKSGHVLAAAIFHGSMNGVIGLSIIFLKGGNDLIVGPFALSGIICLIILNLFLKLFQSKVLKY